MNNLMGGFVGNNSGSINNCYCLLQMEGKKSGMSGFCGMNTGKIRQSFHSGHIRHMSAGFGVGGDLKNCFFFTNQGEEKRVSKLPDQALWRKDSDISGAKAVEELGFQPDMWSYTGDRQVLSFHEEKWYCAPVPPEPLPKREADSKAERTELRIDSVQKLEEFAKGINEGDVSMRTAIVTLTRDLDLSGKDWTPIGIDKAHSFCGSFNGDGHRITNFRIRKKKLSYRGFFGVLEGGVYNLTVDCEVRGGGTVGVLAGHLIRGYIGCCGAVSEIRPKDRVEAVGGLVGISTGNIIGSFAAGRIHFRPVMLPVAAAAALILSLSAGASLYIAGHLPTEQTSVNRPVSEEEAQFPIPDEELKEPPETKSEMHSVAFSTNTEATASLSTGKIDLVYQSINAKADQKVVVQIKLSNGVVIAETGAILPGHQITEMELTERAKKELKKGKYSAKILMIPYSVQDETKSFIETEVPITLTVS